MTEKRCNGCKIEIDCTFKSCEGCRDLFREKYWNRSPEAKELQSLKAIYKYRTNEAWRNQKIAETSALMKSTVVCSECDKVMNYGSLLPHKKCCRGRSNKSTLEQILELSVGVCPLAESDDRGRWMLS